MTVRTKHINKPKQRSTKVPRSETYPRDQHLPKTHHRKSLPGVISPHSLQTRLCERGRPDSYTPRVLRIEHLVVIRKDRRPKNKPPHQVRRQVIYYEFSLTVEWESNLLQPHVTPESFSSSLPCRRGTGLSRPYDR